MDLDAAARAFRDFVAVVKALRTPGTGCPWDLEQYHRTLRPYLIEESYEVLDAIDRGDDPALRDELGDLLLQVVLHAQLADDRGAFTITDVLRRITEKMVRRHPHVFGDVQARDADEVRRNWERIKEAERRAAGHPPAQAEVLARLPEGLPALLRAERLDQKAADGTDGGSVVQLLETLRQQVAALGACADAGRRGDGGRPPEATPPTAAASRRSASSVRSNQSRSSGLNQRACAGRSVIRKRTAMPASTAGIPSTRNTHCQPARPSHCCLRRRPET
jgi:MazG family protein